MGYLGSQHGNTDTNKISHAGLTAVSDSGTVYIEEAELVLICRKLYEQDLRDEGFIDREIVSFNYPEKDFHRVYVGEIIKVLE